MSKAIYKYAVPVDDDMHGFDLPFGARIVRVGSQHDFAGTVFFWAVVTPGAEHTMRRYFRVVGTGHELPPGADYVGSADVSNGVLVWHLLELNQ